MKKLTTKRVLEFMLLQSYNEVKFHQNLIDTWNDPKDIVQRAAVLLRDVHKIYGGLAFIIYQNMGYKK